MVVRIVLAMIKTSDEFAVVGFEIDYLAQPCFYPQTGWRKHLNEEAIIARIPGVDFGWLGVSRIDDPRQFSLFTFAQPAMDRKMRRAIVPGRLCDRPAWC